MDDAEEGFEVVEGIEEDFQDETDEAASDDLLQLIEYLKKMAVDGMEMFQDCSDTSRSRIHHVFSLLAHHLQGLESHVVALFSIAKNYDFNGLRANGYRSCLKVVKCCCESIKRISGEISAGKDNFFLSLRSNYRDMESFVACLGQLKSCMGHLEKLPELGEENCLFSRTDDSLFTIEAENMFRELEALNREPFYGRCLGHQFCKSMQNSLKIINVGMASFGESFNKDTIMNKWALSFVSSGKYFMNPELRAQQVVKLTQNSSIDFCKAFWNISETDLFRELPMIVCPPVQVSHGFEIQPEPLSLPKMDGSGMVEIKLPSSYHGDRGIGVRLISHVLREGQEQLLDKSVSGGEQEVKPASPCLIVHCHGGGFVAQSAKSHEMYLRHWACGVGVPILSVDYSLAPESPYPRALEEIYYVYCWAIDNCDLLGSSGERICFAGDSSGANLMFATCLKAIEEGVRLPDGILGIYAATYVSYAPSPSRLLAMMDPLIPVGVLTRCLAAYTGYDARDVFNNYVKKREAMNDGYMDPVILEKLNMLRRDGNASDSAGIEPSGASTSGNDDGPRPVAQRPNHLTIAEPGVYKRSMAPNRATEAVESSAPPKVKPPRPPPPSNLITIVTAPSDTDNRLPDNGTTSPRNDTGNDSPSDAIVVSNDNSFHSNDSMQSKPISHSSGEEMDSFHSVTEKTPAVVRFQIGADKSKVSRENADMSDEDVVSLETDLSDHMDGLQIGPSSAKKRTDSMIAQAGSRDMCILQDDSQTELPRRKSESVLGTPRPAPIRSKSTAGLSNVNGASREETRSFLWSSLVSQATKCKIKNHLTTMGNLVWGSGPNHSKKTLWQEYTAEPVLSSDMNLPLHVYRYLPVPQDPLISPYCASLDTLSKMPPVYLLACHLDPLLDDSVELAKRLAAAGSEVHLDVLDDLPHGFLNFTLVSREAKMGCDTCIVRIRQILLRSPR